MATQKRKQKKPPAAAKRPRGRPTIRTPEIDEAVLAWVAAGKTLRDFCRQPSMPHRSAIDRWRAEDPAFQRRFARAREDGFDVIAEEALAIADSPKAGKIVTVDKDGKKTVTEDMLGHRKLQIETRLKLLAKWDPKRYGERVEVEHSGTLDLADAIRKARERAANR